MYNELCLPFFLELPYLHTFIFLIFSLLVCNDLTLNGHIITSTCSTWYQFITKLIKLDTDPANNNYILNYSNHYHILL